MKKYKHGKYIMLNFEDGSRILEHRFIMQQFLKRKLETWETVHHKDKNYTNNKISNLKLLSNSEHSKLHAKKTEYIELKCFFCGNIFKKTYSKYKYNKKSYSHIFCSRRCTVKNQWKNKKIGK